MVYIFRYPRQVYSYGKYTPILMIIAICTRYVLELNSLNNVDQYFFFSF